MPGSAPSAAFERGTGVRGDAPAASGARQLGARAGRATANPIRRSTSHQSQAEMSCAVARPMRGTARGSQVVTIAANLDFAIAQGALVSHVIR